MSRPSSPISSSRWRPAKGNFFPALLLRYSLVSHDPVALLNFLWWDWFCSCWVAAATRLLGGGHRCSGCVNVACWYWTASPSIHTQ
jgi:hypothetical protein